MFGAFEWLFLWLRISSRVYFHLYSSCSFIPIRLKVYFDRIVHDETTALFLNSYYYTGGNIYLPALIPFGSKSFRLILSRLNTVVPQYRTFNVNGTWLLTRSSWHLYRVSIHILARTFDHELERPSLQGQITIGRSAGQSISSIGKVPIKILLGKRHIAWVLAVSSSRQNFKWNPWLLMLFHMILDQPRTRLTIG